MAQHPDQMKKIQIVLVSHQSKDRTEIISLLAEAAVQADLIVETSLPNLPPILNSHDVDVVISEIEFEKFSGLEVLATVRHKGYIPFLFIAEMFHPEVMVRAIQQGANDYLLRSELWRLPQAIERAITWSEQIVFQASASHQLVSYQRDENYAMLAAGFSHDLRNILQPLLFIPEILGTKRTDQKIQQLVNVVAECGRRGNEMAESLLTFFKGNYCRRSQISVNSLFQSVDVLLRTTMPEKVTLHMEVGHQSLSIYANFIQLQRCLINLGINAIQAMPEGGHLYFKALESPPNHLCIKVIDNGIGMSKEVLSHLFDPFFSTKPSGSGLGLISCKRIVESYGGQITVSSILKEGTQFTLELPMGIAQAVESLPKAVSLQDQSSMIFYDQKSSDCRC